MNRDVCEHFNPVDLPCEKCKPASVQKSTLREAAQQALEALEGKRYTACGWRSDCDKAITALRAALAEPVQEPVAAPLAEWQINDLIEDLNTVDEVHEWSFRQGVYAAEKHHGVKP